MGGPTPRRLTARQRGLLLNLLVIAETAATDAQRQAERLLGTADPVYGSTCGAVTSLAAAKAVLRRRST